MPLFSSVRATLAHPAFREGAREFAGTGVGIAAWGLVTGVAMVKTGVPVGWALLMTLVVYAGSAQLATLPLMTAGAPLWVIWFTATCVNLRFVIFSNLWRPYFGHYPRWLRMTLGYFSGDVTFVSFMRRYKDGRPSEEQLPYFWGGATMNWVCWQIPSIAGIFLANFVPLSWGLGFAGVLALLGVLLTIVTDRATWTALVVSATAAVAAFSLPLKLNILVAILAAVVVGLGVESMERVWRERRAATTPSAAKEQ